MSGPTDLLSRWLFVLTGCAMIGGAAYAVLHHMGVHDWREPVAVVVVLMAAGILVGSVAIAKAVTWGRRGLACFIVVCMLGAEAYGILLTAERLIAAREAWQAPARLALEHHKRARSDLEVARSLTPLTMARDALVAAEKRKDEAERAIREDASKPGCRSGCVDLLKGAAIRAEEEVNQSRAAIDAHDRRELVRIAEMVRKAEESLRSHPEPAPQETFASMIGMTDKVFSLLIAALGTAGLNLLAGGLIFCGVHGPRHSSSNGPDAAPAEIALRPQVAQLAVVSESQRQVEGKPRLQRGAPPRLELVKGGVVDKPSATAPPSRADRVAAEQDNGPRSVEADLRHVTKFAMTALRPGDTDTPIEEIFLRYHGWCREVGEKPLANAELHGAVVELFRRAGVKIVMSDHGPVARGVQMIDRRQIA